MTSGAQGLKLVILAIQEAESWRIVVAVHPREKYNS
jgi:hypothetical protein